MLSYLFFIISYSLFNFLLLIKSFTVYCIKSNDILNISKIKKNYRMFLCDIKYKNLIDFTDITVIITLKYKYINVNYYDKPLKKYFIYI